MSAADGVAWVVVLSARSGGCPPLRHSHRAVRRTGGHVTCGEGTPPPTPTRSTTSTPIRIRTRTTSTPRSPLRRGSPRALQWDRYSYAARTTPDWGGRLRSRVLGTRENSTSADAHGQVLVAGGKESCDGLAISLYGAVSFIDLSP